MEIPIEFEDLKIHCFFEPPHLDICILKEFLENQNK
jgi:hypothetical protein